MGPGDVLTWNRATNCCADRRRWRGWRCPCCCSSYPGKSIQDRRRSTATLTGTRRRSKRLWWPFGSSNRSSPSKWTVLDRIPHLYNRQQANKFQTFFRQLETCRYLWGWAQLATVWPVRNWRTDLTSPPESRAVGLWRWVQSGKEWGRPHPRSWLPFVGIAIHCRVRPT